MKMKKGRYVEDPEIRKEIIKLVFPKVLSLISDGYNICIALKKLGITKSWFYRNISAQQKAEMDMTKTLNTKYGVGSNY